MFQVLRREVLEEDTHIVTEHFVRLARSSLRNFKDCRGPTHSKVLEKLKELELLNTLGEEALQGVH